MSPNRRGTLERRAQQLKNLLYVPLDILDYLKGMRPPTSRIFVGDGSWRRVGAEFLSYFRRFGGLTPSSRVLDVGCGIGRMAVPLTRYLNSEASYDGIDIVPDGITWCQEHISRRHPNFHFTHADIYNKHYNPGGTVSASAYVFPFADSSFDFVFLTSVFTHMLPSDLERYVAEIARVAAKGGRCLFTFFLLNDESARGIEQEISTFAFTALSREHAVADPRDPEAAVAYQEEYIVSLLLRHGLHVLAPVQYGKWSGRETYLSFQDIIIAEKP